MARKSINPEKIISQIIGWFVVIVLIFAILKDFVVKPFLEWFKSNIAFGVILSVIVIIALIVYFKYFYMQKGR